MPNRKNTKTNETAINYEDGVPDAVARIVGELGRRRRLVASTYLIHEGDPFRSFFVVEHGMMRASAPHAATPSRFLIAGDFFSFNCADVSALSVKALTDCSVICADRRALEAHAAKDVALKNFLQANHARELDLIFAGRVPPHTSRRPAFAPRNNRNHNPCVGQHRLAGGSKGSPSAG